MAERDKSGSIIGEDRPGGGGAPDPHTSVCPAATNHSASTHHTALQNNKESPRQTHTHTVSITFTSIISNLHVHLQK